MESSLVQGLPAPSSPRPAGGFPAVRKGIRRNLFGPVDHQQNKKDLERISQILDDRDRSNWSFDFKKGTPCPGGRYVWEKVDSENTEDIPRAYELPHLDLSSTATITDSRGQSPLTGTSSRGQSPLTVIRPLGELSTNTDRCGSPLTVVSSRGHSPHLVRPSTPRPDRVDLVNKPSRSSPCQQPSTSLSSSCRKRKQSKISG